MEKIENIEEYRTKFESDEHWELKRDFLLKYEDKFPRDRLICLAQVFVNVQLLRCKYPDQIMRQIAELSKGIGMDYKTKQKERLKRTFVKASDAASAKVKKLKLDYSQTSVEERDDDDSQGISKKTDDISIKKQKFSEITWKETTEKPNTSIKKPLRKKICAPDDAVETQPLNKYLQAVKGNHQKSSNSFVSPKVTSMLNKIRTEVALEQKSSKSLLDLYDPNDLYNGNIFLVKRNYLNAYKYSGILFDSLQFSKLQVKKDIFNEGNITCALSTTVKGRYVKLGEGVDDNFKSAKEKAAKEALEFLLKKCFTIEIKKLLDYSEEVCINNLKGEKGKETVKKAGSNEEASEEEIGNDNIGAKMLRLMGWAGGGLGKNEEGIKEPVNLSSAIGRQGLGLQDETAPTPIFRKNVKNILDKMKKQVEASFDSVSQDIVFSSDLSKEQRKYIHTVVGKQYKQLKSVSYWRNNNRFISIKPFFDHRTLFHRLLSQGGSTDKYEVHKPGTLSIHDLNISEPI